LRVLSLISHHELVFFYSTDLALKSIVPVKDRVSACVMATCCHGVCNWNDYVGRDYLISAMQSHDDNFVFGDSEFNMLCVWSAGTVSDISDSAGDDVATKKGDDDNVEEENDHPSTCQFSHQPRQITFKASELVASLGLQCGTRGLGRACQRMIDYGRLQFIRNDLFPQTSQSCDVVHYVSTDVTPQNAALVASNV
jgi:tRNA:m4X modification enzyme